MNADETAYNGKVFNLLWSNMGEKMKEEVRAKAAWEHMTLSAVLQCWWKSRWNAAAVLVAASAVAESLPTKRPGK